MSWTCRKQNPWALIGLIGSIRLDVALVAFVVLMALMCPNVHAQVALKPGSAQLQELVFSHNQWRARLGIRPLKWSADLAESSRQWAGHLAEASDCPMHHSDTPVGENLFWASPVTWSDGRVEVQTVEASKVVDSWGSESLDYSYATNTCRPGKACGHYTQLVWADTEEVGCAAQLCKSKAQIWVCQYRPAGNVVGYRPY